MREPREHSTHDITNAEPLDQVPFLGGLRTHVAHEKAALQQAGDQTDYVIRESAYDRAGRRVIEKAKALKTHFDELARYGIDAPVSLVVGKNVHDEDTAFVATDNITGIRLLEYAKEKSVDRQELSKLLATHYGNLLKYFRQKFEDGTEFLADISRSDQYVFGTTSKEPSAPARLFLVDTEGQMRGEMPDLATDLFEVAEEILKLKRNKISLPQTEDDLCLLLADMADKMADKYEGSAKEFGMRHNSAECRKYIIQLRNENPPKTALSLD